MGVEKKLYENNTNQKQRHKGKKKVLLFSKKPWNMLADTDPWQQGLSLRALVDPLLLKITAV
jgi:hypothetical protein